MSDFVLSKWQAATLADADATSDLGGITPTNPEARGFVGLIAAGLLKEPAPGRFTITEVGRQALAHYLDTLEPPPEVDVAVYSAEFLLSISRGSFRVVENPVPEGAKVDGVWVKAGTNEIAIGFSPARENRESNLVIQDLTALHPPDSWTTAEGPVLWWRPGCVPWVGTPLDSDWPGLNYAGWSYLPDTPPGMELRL